jgi:hypothetical protein
MPVLVPDRAPSAGSLPYWVQVMDGGWAEIIPLASLLKPMPPKLLEASTPIFTPTA